MQNLNSRRFTLKALTAAVALTGLSALPSHAQTGGTIIHELSHFNVIAGTDDFAYGHTAAKQLALSNPAQARLNADSHEYFAENTPSLP